MPKIVVVILAEAAAIRGRGTKCTEIQPTVEEAVDEGVGARVLEQAFHLGLKHSGFSQFVFGGQIQKLFVGHR